MTEPPAKLFSCEFCKIFKNIQNEEHLQATAASGQIRKQIFTIQGGPQKFEICMAI